MSRFRLTNSEAESLQSRKLCKENGRIFTKGLDYVKKKS
jgi:hypothetical protein